MYNNVSCFLTIFQMRPLDFFRCLSHPVNAFRNFISQIDVIFIVGTVEHFNKPTHARTNTHTCACARNLVNNSIIF